MHAVFHSSFRKKFKKLPEKIRECFRERLGSFLEDPTDPVLNNHSVDRRFTGCRSINITGDYRAIFYEMDHAAIFINIGRHGQLY